MHIAYILPVPSDNLRTQRMSRCSTFCRYKIKVCYVLKPSHCEEVSLSGTPAKSGPVTSTLENRFTPIFVL
jgi:hypothetical protein